MRSSSRIKSIISAVIVVMLIVSAGIPVLAANTSAKTVKMGYFPEPGMMNGAREGNQKTGYVYDYIQELAANTGWKYEYVYGNFSELYQMLLNGKIDMLPYVTYTEARSHEVFFPEMEMGNEQFYIASLNYGNLSDDLHELEGKRIGTTKDAFQNGPFNELIKKKGVSCELVEFPLITAKWRAYEKGEIDYSIETSTIYQDIDVHAVYKFGERYPYFLIISPNRKDLLEELNSAQKSLFDANPDFLENLKVKYLSGIPIFKELPSEGAKWLEKHNSIVIGTYDSNEPYVIENKDGSVSGIAPDQLTLALEKLGVDIPIEWKLFPGREQAVKALYAGEIDCINPYYHGYSEAESDGLIISQTVYHSSFSVLYSDQYTDKTLSIIATLVTRLGANYVKDYYPDSKIVPCQNGYECIKMLDSGKATCVIMYSDVLQLIDSKSVKRHNIKELEANCEVCFAALPQNAGLISIINKGFPFVSNIERNAIQNKYNIETQPISILQFLKLHPEIIWAVIAAVILVVMIIILQRNRIDREKMARRMESESSRKIIDRFTANFEAVFVGNLVDGTYKPISIKKKVDSIFLETKSISEGIEQFVSKKVYPADREKVSGSSVTFDNVKEKMAVGASLSMEFRSITDDGYLWNRATLVRIGEDEVMLGIMNCDDEIVSKHVTEKLMNDYDAIYVVDLIREEIRPAKQSRVSGVGMFSEKKPYSQTVQAFAETVASQYKQDWINFSNIDYVSRYMESEDHREYVFELPGAERTMRRFSIDVVERSDGKPVTMLYTFMGIDDKRANMINLNRRLAQQKVLLDYFIGTFTSAYFVDLENETFEILNMSHEFADSFGKFGINRDSMNRFIAEHIHPEDREIVLQMTDREYIRNRLKTESSFTFVVREVFDNAEKTMHGIIVRGTDEDHVAVGFMDITENTLKEKEDKAKLEEALEMAKTASKAKTDFLFNMSHDIRTPMNAIVGFTNMAVKHIDDKEKVIDSLEKTKQASDLLLSLINSILDMSRIESGKATVEETEGDVRESFESIKSTMNELAKTKDIELNFELGNIDNRYVYCDHNRCIRIFVNIISNAVKYSHDGGKIKVICEQIGRKDNFGIYRYTFADNGIGMSEEFQKHVFEEFSREQTSTTSGIQGTGLGLAVCKSFTELMGGTIKCESKQGIGTVFYVTLPFRIREVENPAEEKTAEEFYNIITNADFKGRKALLVEDNELNREIAIDILGEEGIVIDEADDGSVAVEILKEKGPDYYDFILMDIQMPVMNGYEATKTIRAMYPGSKLPIIALSANAFSEDKARSVAAGMNDHVAKPINVDELKMVLSRFM